ncbi:MAG: hypothetical protein WCC22_05675 [Terriglobales bacterium]
MLKKTKKSKKSTKKLGRPEVIRPEDLLDRYRALKQFLEHDWGRIGLELQRVRQPDDVWTALKLVPGVEWCTPFRDQPAACLLEDGEIEVEKPELDLLRQQHQDADDTERRLYSEYHSAYEKAAAATTALKAAISQFGAGLNVPRFFWVIFLTARELRVGQLTNETNRIKDSLDRARETKQLLKKQLTPRRAWFARNEVVEFRKSTRFENSAVNFAKAMAGLPEYGWLHSFRKCSKIREVSDKATSYLLFEILEMLVKKTKPVNLRKLEMRLRDELLRTDANLFVRGYVGPNWAYMKRAFAECRGKGYERADLPYRIMGRFLHNVERPKSITEVELAKLEQFV